MSDILMLFFNTFWSIFGFLDSIVLFGSLTLLKLIVILTLFYIAFNFFIPKKGDN